MKATSDRICETELYILKFSLLDNLVEEDLEKFWNQQMPVGSLFEKFNAHLKRALKIPPQ